MIALSAALTAYESVRRLQDPRPLTHVGVVLTAGLIGFAGNEPVAVYRIRVGRAIGSAALVADRWHARADGLTSLAVVEIGVVVDPGLSVVEGHEIAVGANHRLLLDIPRRLEATVHVSPDGRDHHESVDHHH